MLVGGQEHDSYKKYTYYFYLMTETPDHVYVLAYIY